MTDASGPGWDYVIVGSGAGGGTLAARLAEAGMRVFLLEAAESPLTMQAPRLPDDYDVPGFHPFASENAAMSWDFEVHHYSDEAIEARDFKYDAARGGVFYPRAAALGGCTAHNAMIFILPHDSDWDHIAVKTDDRSWRAASMRGYARRVEACRYRDGWRALHQLGIDPTGHGWDGWLTTERAVPLEALGDEDMRGTVMLSSGAYVDSLPRAWLRVLRWMRSAGDPNARQWPRAKFEGLCYTPLSTSKHRRVGARERVLQARDRHPDRLQIEYDALATRVLFDAEGAATGVEYLKGRRLYRAHALPGDPNGERREVHARRGVVLCAGAFNTPQLLMLSGIGPAAHLKERGIPLRSDSPCVGRNLQDRYEIAVTHQMRQPWGVLEGARFERGDRLWQRWSDFRSGLYASGGAALGVISRSSVAGPDPDIFCMALPVQFRGYRHGFSNEIRDHLDRLTWAILKGHTRNRAGSVTLQSADPRVPPRIDFRYFDPVDDPEGKDLKAMVEAIGLVRKLTAPLIARKLIERELEPGPDRNLEEYVRDTAWGHHASCTCAIGTRADESVIDSTFAVHGTRRLRVVDASVFPRIPGLFIVSAVYMIAEKAADTILQAASHEAATT